MSDRLVCPDCGNDEFSRDAAAMLRLTGSVYTSLGFEEATEERLDIERDYDTVRCTDCQTDYDPDDLVTEATYNESEADYE